MSDLNLLSPGISAADGCPILRRLKAFIGSEGVASVLRYTFRDHNGLPLDLSGDLVEASEISDGLVVSESPSFTDTVLVKFREFTVLQDRCETWLAEGTVYDAANGVVDVVVPKNVYGQSGIYTVSFGFVQDGSLRVVQNALLSIERTLWGFDTRFRGHTSGPPTLGEIRMMMYDSDPVENNALLCDVEFSDEQLVLAMTRPVNFYNEMAPQLNQLFDTRNFPSKESYAVGVKGCLLMMAAERYRRNKLNITAGGKTLNDMDRDASYERAAQVAMADFRTWALQDKAARNARQVWSASGSQYGGWNGSGW